MIYIEVLNQYWDPCKKLKISQDRDFEIWIAKKFTKLLKQNIIKQRFAPSWKPLNKSYRHQKAKQGLSTNMWEATEELRKSISVRGRGDNLTIGFSKRKIHDQDIEMIATVLEFGSPVKNIPPRPLYRRVKSNLDKAMWLMYHQYKQGKKP